MPRISKNSAKRPRRAAGDYRRAGIPDAPRPLKVIHAPLNFAGQTYLLSQALREAGIDSISYRIASRRGNAVDVYAFKDDRIIEFDWDNRLGYLFRATQEIISEKPDIVHLWHRPLVYGRHDDPLNGMDLPFLRLGGARIGLRFTGYELRRKSLEMKINPFSPFHYGFEYGFPEDSQKRFYDFIGTYIDTFFVQDPEMQTYCPQARIVPRVLDLSKFSVVETEPKARPMVVHAPTDDLLKGTNFVLKAVEELKEEGLDFDFRLIKDMPNAQALEQYRAADIVIDQILIGWYGVLAMEAMAMGKAVIAYIRDDLTGYFGAQLPLLNANPETIKQVLRGAVKDAELRQEVGRHGRTFVEATHDSRRVARDLAKIYDEMLAKPASSCVPDFSYQWDTAEKNSFNLEVATAVRRILPSFTLEELRQKLRLLADAEQLTAGAQAMTLVRSIPARTPEELHHKLQWLASAGSGVDLEEKLAADDGLLGLARQIPENTAGERRRKLQLLAQAGTLAELQYKLGVFSDFEQNLLALLRRIPAKDARELEDKIASLIPKKLRANAIDEERQKGGSHNTYLLGLARRIPAANPAELERKIEALRGGRRSRNAARRQKPSYKTPDHVRSTRWGWLFYRLERWNERIKAKDAAPASSLSAVRGPDDAEDIVVPSEFSRSAAAFSFFEENLLRSLRLIPAATPEELERKIASLLPEKARAAAVARAKERSQDFDAFLVNLARHIAAKDPEELADKISSLTPASIAPASEGRGVVCIVTRKPIGTVTRAPRMAKALVDAGYHVVVVSPAPPVDELAQMCPQVEYVVAKYRAFTHDIVLRLEERRRKRRHRREQRERAYQAAVTKGAWRAPMRRLGRRISATAAVASVRRRLWSAFVVAPSVFLLKSDTQNAADLHRDLMDRDAIGIAIKYAYLLTQWASTHAFASVADQLTAGRHFDIVQAYDNYGLVAGARLAKRTGAKLIYDAVEVATDRVAQDLNRLEKLRERRERDEEARIFLKADATTGTGDALAGWYAERYNIRKPLVVRNTRFYWPYREDGRLRDDIGVGPEAQVMVWCGSAYPQQGLEVAIRALAHLSPTVHLAVISEVAMMWRKYVMEELPALAAAHSVADRVHLLPAREPNDLVPYISGGNLGFVLSIPVNHPNQYYNLPNKFFEYIMARLPVGTLAFPEVMNIVNQFEIGCVMDEHDSVRNAAIIQQMLEPETYASLRANVMKAAEVLCWENESRPYVELIDSLMPGPHRASALAARGEARAASGRSPLIGAATPAMVPAGDD